MTLILTLVIVACGPPSPTTSISPPENASPTAGAGAASPPPQASVEVPSVPTQPQALPLPAGDPAAQARAIVESLKSGVDPGAAIQTLFMAAGIPVVDPSGAVIPFDGPYSGLAVEPFEVWMMADLAQRGGGMQLVDLAAVLTAGAIEALVDEPIADILLADLRDAAQSADPVAQRWALLVAELGRQRAEPSDPLGDVAVADVFLDALQVQLILRRFASDIATYARDELSQGGISLAVARPGPLAEPRVTQARRPCAFSGWGEVVVTGAEETFSRVVQKGLEILAEKEALIGGNTLPNMVRIANMISDYATLVITFMVLEVKVELEGDPPLVRTKEQVPQVGDNRQLKATVRMKMGNKDLINCLRAIIAVSGVTVSVPNDGPVEGAGVNWVALQGFPPGPDAFVQFFGGNPADEPTDVDGVSRIGIQGLGQKEKLPADAQDYERFARVRVLVQLQKADILKDLWAALLTAEGAIIPTGDPDSFLKLPVELLYRTRWLAPVDLTVPVRDWTPPGYHLKITYTYEGSLRIGDLINIESSGSGTDTWEGEIFPTEVDGTGQPTVYEGLVYATSDGRSSQVSPEATCRQTWSGHQELLVTGEVKTVDGVREIALIFDPYAPPHYSLSSATGGLLCATFNGQTMPDGEKVLPFGNTIIYSGIPLDLRLPSELPDQQRIPFDLSDVNVKSKGEWVADWSEAFGCTRVEACF